MGDGVSAEDRRAPDGALSVALKLIGMTVAAIVCVALWIALFYAVSVLP